MGELKYIGHIISADGIKAVLQKIESIVNIPKNVKQLKRFMSMISYLSKYLPNISKITESLRTLEHAQEE